eukprot:365776-Chlamydomonas_euryale.AAC.13
MLKKAMQEDQNNSGGATSSMSSRATDDEQVLRVAAVIEAALYGKHGSSTSRVRWGRQQRMQGGLGTAAARVVEGGDGSSACRVGWGRQPHSWRTTAPCCANVP